MTQNNKLVLFLVTATLSPSIVHAEVWPSEQIRAGVHVFSPNRELNGFAYYTGLTPSESVARAETRAEYFMMRPDPSWGNSIGCESRAREHGYIHTYEDTFPRDQNVKIAVPIRIVFETSATQGNKKQALFLPLLKVSVFTVTEDNTVGALINGQEPELFRLQDFATEEERSNLSTPLSINYDSILTGKTWSFPRGVNYRVRVEWFGEGLCGEDVPSTGQVHPTVFAIGDQFRLLKVTQ